MRLFNTDYKFFCFFLKFILYFIYTYNLNPIKYVDFDLDVVSKRLVIGAGVELIIVSNLNSVGKTTRCTK